MLEARPANLNKRLYVTLSAISVGNIGLANSVVLAPAGAKDQKSLPVTPVQVADSLRYVGSSSGRPDIQRAMYAGNSDRNIKRRWLREAMRENSLQNALQMERAARQSATQAQLMQAASRTQPAVIERMVDRYAKACEHYQLYLTGSTPRPAPQGVAFSPFQYSRRITAERLLREFYGVSNADLPSAIADVLGSMDQGQRGDGNSGGGSGGSSDGGSAGHQGKEDPAPKAGDGFQISAAGPSARAEEKTSDRLRQYLVLEMARDDPSLSLEQQQAISHRQRALYADSSLVIDASQELALLALRETGGIPAEFNASLPSADNVRDPLRKPTQGFNERFRSIVDHYPPGRVIEGIRMLTRSIDTLGMARGFHLRGEALGSCLRMMRDLSVISLVMDKTSRLKHDLLLKNFAEKFPREADVWQAICALTESTRSIAALTDVITPCRFTPVNELFFMQRIAGILRDLPIAVWTDPNGRIEVVGQLSQHCAALSNRA